MKRKRTRKGIKEAEDVDDLEIQPPRPSLADLPSPIIADILLRLPIKSILICKCVCTSWHSIISDPYFTKLHFKCAPVNVMVRTNDPKRVSRALHLLEFEPQKFENQNLASDNEDGHLTQFCSCEDFLKPNCNRHMKLEAELKLPIRDAKMVLDKMLKAKNGGRKRSYIACKPKDGKFAVVNSCNGLLCLCDPEERNPLVVCNPITGEFMRLPEVNKVENWTYMYPLDSGFGFHEKTNEYKVLRLYNRYVLNQRCGCTFVEIHTLGSGLWRSVECVPCWLRELKFPTCLNGSLHWLAFNRKKGSILCFNLETERFHSFPSPPEVLYIGMSSIENISMGELNGRLYVCGPSYLGSVYLWVMMKYGVGESWAKVLQICARDGERWPRGLYQPMKLFKDGSLFMYHSRYGFMYCNRRKNRPKILKVYRAQFKFEAIAHVPNLISLKDAIKGDNVEVLNVNSRCAAFKLREENDVPFFPEENGKNIHLLRS